MFETDKQQSLRQIALLIGVLALMTLFGALGFRTVSGASWVDSLYMAVITLTTVGYSEAVPLDETGKIFVIVYLVLGLSTFTYCALQFGQWIVTLRVDQLIGGRKMQATIDKFSNHSIVCGYGRMGRTICDYLASHGEDFVVIDNDIEILSRLREEMGWHFVNGDATDDATLEAAGIDRAASLAAALPTDADNVYVVLSSRMMNPALQIIARAEDDRAVNKITRAGATRVISPFQSAGTKMARMMLHPSIEDFLEIAGDSGNDLELLDVTITERSPYAGKRLMDTDLHARGVMVIGIRRATGERLMPPTGQSTIQEGDSVFAFGPTHAVSKMFGE